MQKKLFSQRNKLFYFLAVWSKRIMRYKQWYFSSIKFAKYKDKVKLPYRVKKHQSVLIRKLGDSDLQLQLNKVENLKIAIKKIDGIIIRPGVGGGLCQIANLLNWLAIHSPLTVTERHHHTFDPFPDDGRVLPFGSGATIFYNYGDFQITNNTKDTFQINLWMSAKCLEGELRINQELDYSYHVFEKNHKFIKRGEEYYRQNEIWRNKISKFEGGKILDTELLIKNCSLVKYIPEEFDIE